MLLPRLDREFTLAFNDFGDAGFMAKKQKILIVDVNNAFIEDLKRLFFEEYQILSMRFVEISLTEIASFSPDLIFLSLSSPNFDGFELCSKLKNHQETSSIPVIFVSNELKLDEKMKGFMLGGADYLVGPMETSELKLRVKTHLELKNAHQSVQMYNQQLRDMLEERTKELIKSERQSAFCLMVQGIIHNLRNPLVGILGHADYIKNRTRKLIREIEPNHTENPGNCINGMRELIQDADAILNAAQIMSDMIDTMMIKSRSDKSSEIDSVDLNEIIQNELDFLRADLKFKNCTKKRIELSQKELMVNIVVSEISQVFQNLIRNAIQALWREKNAVISIASGEDKHRVWFSITDNGPGISQKIIGKIFDPFFTTKPMAVGRDSLKPLGTGLGLYTCMEILKSYKGDIKVDSVEGKGTTFIVYLPKAEPKEKEHALATTEHGVTENKY